MEWTVPTFPHDVRDDPSIEVIDDAFLTRHELGRLRTFSRPDRYLRGAVHDAEGRLVVSSQKLSVPHHPWVAADPARARVNNRAELLQGRWMYGGHWVQHFGHFIVETITTLWPTGQEPVGLVFHKYLHGPVTQERWMLRLLELAGYGALPVEIVGGARARRVEQLVVPSRSVVANGWGHPQAREVWERVVSPFRGGGPRRVFLTRSAFNDAQRRAGSRRARSSPERDRAMDGAFRAAGFDVVAPETLALEDQLRLVADAEVVAGGSGSALHLTAFAPAGTRVVEIGDERNPAHPVGMQRVIDHLGGHPHRFLRGDLSTADLQRRIADLDD
ncbi:glycosyltransferase 61 family protein [Nocardioides sp. 1609]|uniref:glycosyltransferase family 61 protein n=1 Tax=Nocardioides sp. 1609 TaxID=2508327 RepID=UPI00106F51F9|nr:glycosyltransferase 61 family protein [Nocardioides sp. 1609]